MHYPEELTNTYEIYEQIGSGGGGTVFRATHKRLQKTVVLKKLIGSRSNMQECRIEVDILKNLRHSYLPQVLDFIESSEGIYTVIDFIPGKSLGQMLDEGYRFNEKEVLKYTRQLCEALEYLHSQDPPIIHGDIKPDNIMITPEGNVCLIDFNISGILEGKGAQTFGYTPGYSAPEQAAAFEEICRRMQAVDKTAFLPVDKTMTIVLSSDEKTVLLEQDDESTLILLKQEPVAIEEKTDLLERQKDVIIIDKRSDVFSLGATIYALLTGKMFDISFPMLEIEGVSNGFWVVLSKALELLPDNRYQDAGMMLQAILQVHKKDKLYKRLLLRQELIFATIVIAFMTSVFMVIEGRRQLGQEKEEYYYALVTKMQDGVKDFITEEQFEGIYTEAIGMYQEYFDAYYVKARYLFQNSDYERTIEYMEQVSNNILEASDELWGNWYHLYAECYFRVENYEQACVYYETSLRYRSDNPSIYRDYAISLVYLGQVKQAEEILQKAIEEGMEQVDVYMVQGEIARMTSNTETAIECFKAVIEEAADEYLLQRVYVMNSKVYEQIGTSQALIQDVECLQEGIERLSLSNRLLLYERLAQDYILLGEAEKSASYYAEAISVFSEIKSMNWDTFFTYNNAIILCQRMGELENAEKWIQEMLQEYPNNYMSHVRASYLELEKQNQKVNAERNYKAFEEFYLKAKELYQQNTAGNITDAEMQLLDEMYQQVVEGGWL